MSRQTKIGLVVATATLIVISSFVMHVAYMVGSSREVFGSVIGFKQVANKKQPMFRRYVSVELDEGPTVVAQIDGYVTLIPGDRAVFVEITTPLLGFKRYQFHGYLESDRFAPNSKAGNSPP